MTVRSLSLLRAGLLLMMCWGGLARTTVAQDWARFRGPNGNGVVTDVTFPVTWNEDDYAWKTELPGKGHSCPVVWGDKIFLMSGDADSARRYIVALDRSNGELVWTRTYESEPHTLHARNTYASSTPAVDAESVYVAWSTPDQTLLKALDHDGQERWTRDLGPFVSQHGFGTSPIVVDGRLVLFFEQQKDQLPAEETPGQSKIMAFDCASGETLWETPVNTTRVCYSVPCVRELPEGGTELVTCNTGNGIFAVNPANGRINWEINVFSQRCVASPVLFGDLVIGSCGSGGGNNELVAVRGGENPEEVFRLRANAGYVPTPIVVGDLLFVFYDRGVASCVDLKSGDTLWKERLSGGFSGSPVCAQDRIFVPDDNGKVICIAATAEFKLLGETDLEEECRSTPAIAGDLLLIRTVGHLIAVKAE